MSPVPHVKILKKYGACLSCRQRKLKCDGVKPICSVCTKDGRECQYVEKTQAKSKTSALEDRLELLQRQLYSLTAKKGSPDSIKTGSSGSLGSLPSPVNPLPASFFQGPQTTSSANDGFAQSQYNPIGSVDSMRNPVSSYTSSQPPFPKPSPTTIFPSEAFTSEPRPMSNPFGTQMETPELEMLSSSHREDSMGSASGQSSSMLSTPATHLQSASSSSSLALASGGSTNDLSSLDELLNMPGALELRNNNGMPDLLLFTELASIYFEKVEPLFLHFPHRNRFLVKSFGMLLSPQVPISAGDRGLLFAVCAHGAARSDKYTHLAKSFGSMAQYAIGEYVNALGDCSSSVRHFTMPRFESKDFQVPLSTLKGKEDFLQLLQANILLGNLSMANCMYNSGWLHMGIAENLSQICGLDSIDTDVIDSLWVGQMRMFTNPPSLPPPSDWVEEEERRRTYWALWCFARFMCAGSTYSSRIPLSGLPHKLPCDEKAWQEEWSERPTEDINGPNLAALQIETVNIHAHVALFIRGLEGPDRSQGELPTPSLPDFGLAAPPHPAITSNRAQVFNELDRAITRQKLKIPKTFELGGNYMILTGLLVSQITLYGGVACPGRRRHCFGIAARGDSASIAQLPTPHEAQQRLLLAAKSIVSLIGPLSDMRDLNTMGSYMPMPFAVACDCLRRSPSIKTDPSIREDIGLIKLWLGRLKDKWPKAGAILQRMENMSSAKFDADVSACSDAAPAPNTTPSSLVNPQVGPPQTVSPSNAFSESPWSSTSEGSSLPPQKFSMVASPPGSLTQDSRMSSYLDSRMTTTDTGTPRTPAAVPVTPSDTTLQCPLSLMVADESMKHMSGIWQAFDLHTGLTPAPLHTTPAPTPYTGQNT